MISNDTDSDGVFRRGIGAGYLKKGARMKHSELYKIASPKPCPFCGWGTIVDGSYLTGHSCACMSCGTRTRKVKTWEEAVELWNAREYENKAESEE